MQIRSDTNTYLCLCLHVRVHMSDTNTYSCLCLHVGVHMSDTFIITLLMIIYHVYKGSFLSFYFTVVEKMKRHIHI
jgi:hypothetical protein